MTVSARKPPSDGRLDEALLGQGDGVVDEVPVALADEADVRLEHDHPALGLSRRRGHPELLDHVVARGQVLEVVAHEDHVEVLLRQHLLELEAVRRTNVTSAGSASLTSRRSVAHFSRQRMFRMKSPRSQATSSTTASGGTKRCRNRGDLVPDRVLLLRSRLGEPLLIDVINDAAGRAGAARAGQLHRFDSSSTDSTSTTGAALSCGRLSGRR